MDDLRALGFGVERYVAIRKRPLMIASPVLLQHSPESQLFGDLTFYETREIV